MKVPLLEYLDKLEATAKAATAGTWNGVNDWNSNNPSAPVDTIESTRAPNEFERSSWGDVVHVQIAQIEEDFENPDANIAHILATQPRATLALIAKLREAVQLIAELNHWAAAHNQDSGCLGRQGNLDLRVADVTNIEVPE